MQTSRTMANTGKRVFSLAAKRAGLALVCAACTLAACSPQASGPDREAGASPGELGPATASVQAMQTPGPVPAPLSPAVEALLEHLRADQQQIQAGRFTMGSLRGERSERPLREVSVDAFSLARHEIRNRDFAVFAESTGRSEWPGLRNRTSEDWEDTAAAYLSWEDAMAFIAWLNELTGEGWRLPTEAQWEYAARAGTETAYWWGDEYDATRGNGVGRHGPDTWAKAAPVGRFEPNPWGLYDMTGNVTEWVQDCWNRDYSGLPTDGSAYEPDPCEWRVLRGGSWLHGDAMHRSAARYYLAPDDANSTQTGFRLAR